MNVGRVIGFTCQIWGADMNTFVAQEGGNHYQTEYQHWDWVLDIGLGYLDGGATKYVSRWRKKNGLQDLLKSKTYMAKMLATFDVLYAMALEPVHNVDELTSRFILANKLSSIEGAFCVIMSKWTSKEDLKRAMFLLDLLIANAPGAQEEGATGASPVAAPMVANAAASPILPLPCGKAGGTIGQAAPANTPTDVHGNYLKAGFGPCPCGCGRERRKNMQYATDQCRSSGMEHPFGYDDWTEGPVSK